MILKQIFTMTLTVTRTDSSSSWGQQLVLKATAYYEELTPQSGLCKNLGHIIDNGNPICLPLNGYFLFDLRTPYSWHGTIFGFKTLKQPEEESYISAFKIYAFNATGDIPTGINCTLGSQPDGQPEKCFGVRASNDDIHSSWFDKPITTRYIKLVASDCVSTKCIGSISLIFGNADESKSAVFAK